MDTEHTPDGPEGRDHEAADRLLEDAAPHARPDCARRSAARRAGSPRMTG